MPLCICPQCKVHFFVDPKTGKQTNGRMVGDTEYKEHRAQVHANSAAAEYFADQRPASIPFNKTSPLSTTKLVSSANSGCLDSPIAEKLSSVERRLANVQGCEVQTLVFANPPHSKSLPVSDPSDDRLLLQDSVGSNAAIVKHENWVYSALDIVPQWKASPSADSGLIKRCLSVESALKLELDLLRELKMSHWEKQRETARAFPEKTRIINNATRVSKPFASSHPVILACYVLVTVMHLICGVSQSDCQFLLATLNVILRLSTQSTSDTARTEDDLPQTIDTILRHMNLSPKTQSYVCCSRCFKTYLIDPEHPSSYPPRCTYQSTKKSAPCNNPLGTRCVDSSNQLYMKPIRLFLYHELEDWIGQLYSQFDLEKWLDRPINDKESSDAVWDIWDSPEFREFLGPERDPAKPFLRREKDNERLGNEGRLIFSLNMDGFNPFGNKESGKKVSTGAIYLVCLNLPPDLRYDLENMFLVGIIPGPDEPSKEQIDHVLRPLVDDLLILWEYGFFLTSTATFPQGRLTRGAVIPLICDLPAARQMSGFAGHASNHFCSFCLLPSTNIDSFNYTTWVSRTEEEHRQLAQEWKNAQSPKERDELYGQNGVHWSELLRLPYWDPTRFVMIDTMHGFFLRLFQRHCRQVWGMSVELEDGEMHSLVQDQNTPSEEEMKTADVVFRYKGNDTLRKLNHSILKALARSTGTIAYGGSKKTLVKNLIAYRVEKGWFDDDGHLIGQESLHPTSLSLPHASCCGTVTSSKLSLTQSDQDGPLKGTPGSVLVLPKTRKPRRNKNDAPSEEEVALGLQLLETGTKKRIRTLRKPLLMRLCTLKQIPFDLEKCLVEELVEALEKWRLQMDLIDASGNLLNPEVKRHRTKQVAVLGRDTLKEVWADTDRLSLPSWVACPPRQPGVAKRGKFTADQWRTFCTINLVVTLTRLWGGEPATSRKCQMLQNFLHLVTAVKLASMRCMTHIRIERYEYHMHQYLTTLQVLYPGTAITPYQHLALHLPRFLRRFGPVHAWRCFPFERYNYVLQRIPTNMKFGDLEKTMLNRFCMAQRLRATIKLQELPADLEGVVYAWEKKYATNIRGTLLGDSFSFDESFRHLEEQVTWEERELTVLPGNWFSNLQHWVSKHDIESIGAGLSKLAYRRSNISRLGETYQVRDTNKRNSCIYYRDPTGTVCAGSISGIFSHCRPDTRTDGKQPLRVQTFFIIDQFKPLPSGAHLNPYCDNEFSTTSGRVFQDTFFFGATIVPSEDLLYHFASIAVEVPLLDTRCLLAIPLDRS